MTERLYHDDPERLRFEARVVEVRRDARGAAVRLDRTAFYPTSGGQPHDTGRLADGAVVDVTEDGEAIWHTLADDAPVPAVGTLVVGEVDAERRRDHMQQHAGQHLLSAVLRGLGAETVGFHLGPERVSIDLDRMLGADSLVAAEAQANRLIWEGRAIRGQERLTAELDPWLIRKVPDPGARVRIVTIEGVEANACCGTHPRSTAAIGVILLLDWEPHRGGMRVHFVCGERALQETQRRGAVLRQLVAQLGLPIGELADGVARVRAERDELTREIERLRQEQLARRAEDVASTAMEVAGLAFAFACEPELAPAAQRHLAQTAAERCGGLALVVVDDATGVRRFVLARASGAQVDVRGVLPELLALVGGRGGGNAQVVQGGGQAAGPAEALAETVRGWVRGRSI